MALISVSNIEKSYGPREVLKGLALSIERGDRIGIIGRNGCGKTTLLRILTGREEPDRGARHVAKGLRVAWLDQVQDVDPERTVIEEARTALADLVEVEQRLEEWHKKIADAPDHHLTVSEHEAFARDEAAFVALGGQERERLLEIALQKLSLDGEIRSRCFGQLSGGERTRLALARILISPFDVLVLDEPTNHLDVTAIEWLQDVLTGMNITCLVVSHDRAFLDAVVNRVAELDEGRTTVVNGNYSQFLTVKAERMKTLEREAELESRFVAKEMDFIRRHINSQRTREAKGRLKRLERREVIEVPREQRTFELKLKGGKTHADVVASGSELSQFAGERALFEGLSFELYCGEKVGVVGPNGAGKTTLARIILGQIPSASGRVRLAPQIKVGIFTQDLSHLIDERTVLEEYARLVNPPNLNVARGPLGAFLFSGNRVEQRVGSLSGGERARLALCILVAKENDLLVLDEPTNHLDIPSRQSLEEALLEFPGTCLIITHDRRFIDRVATRVLWIDGPRTKFYLGDYSSSREQREEELAEADERAAAAKALDAKKTSRPDQVPTRAKKINEFKLNAIESEIQALEQRKAELTGALCDENVYRDRNRIREVRAELESLDAKLLLLNGEWEAVIDAAGEKEN